MCCTVPAVHVPDVQIVLVGLPARHVKMLLCFKYRWHSECLPDVLHIACCLSATLLLSTSRCCPCLAMCVTLLLICLQTEFVYAAYDTPERLTGRHNEVIMWPPEKKEAISNVRVLSASRDTGEELKLPNLLGSVGSMLG